MVHPLMRQTSHARSDETAQSIAATIIDMLPRLHVLVIGPGLGRDPLMQDTCALVIQAARKANIPFILDADGLNLATTRPELVQDYKECILTPNVVEFGRLCKSKGIDTATIGDGKGAELVSKAFGGITILQKGPRDYICSGGKTYVSDLEGGLKRSGGQGDTLTGSLATFLAWRMAYLEGMWETKGNLSGEELMALAAFGGSSITRVRPFSNAAMTTRDRAALDVFYLPSARETWLTFCVFRSARGWPSRRMAGVCRRAI